MTYGQKTASTQCAKDAIVSTENKIIKILPCLGSGVKYSIYGSVDGFVGGVAFGAYSAYRLMNCKEMKKNPSATVPYFTFAVIALIASTALGTVGGGTVGAMYGVAKGVLRK